MKLLKFGAKISSGHSSFTQSCRSLLQSSVNLVSYYLIYSSMSDPAKEQYVWKWLSKLSSIHPESYVLHKVLTPIIDL